MVRILLTLEWKQVSLSYYTRMLQFFLNKEKLSHQLILDFRDLFLIYLVRVHYFQRWK